jgi:hypothetical protein
VKLQTWGEDRHIPSHHIHDPQRITLPTLDQRQLELTWAPTLAACGGDQSSIWTKEEQFARRSLSYDYL